MGDYTELVLSCTLKPEMTKEMLENIMEQCGVYVGSSYYFPLCAYMTFQKDPLFEKGYKDYNSNYFSIRTNIKNYENQLENFVQALLPYIVGGSGDDNQFIGYIIFEYARTPTLLYLDELINS